MSFQEDQENEIEALEAIFENEFKLIEKNPPSFEILLEPCPGEGDDENHVRVLFKVKFPESYPDTAPEITLEAAKGLNEKKMVVLDKIAADAVEEGLGEVVIFTVTEALKEWLSDNNEKEKGMHEEMMERAMKEKETKTKEAQKAARKKDDDDDDDDDSDYQDEGEDSDEGGRETDWKVEDLQKRRQEYKNPLKIGVDDLVTAESFAKWKIDFAAHKKAEEEKAGIVKEVVVEKKTTGREFFQQEIAKSLETKDAGDDKAEEVFWFNENIYDDDDEDLPDSDEDE